MEVLLFALFFISAVIFFIAGKDDFGRTESKLIIKEEKNIKEEDKVIAKEEKEDKVAEEGKKEVKVAVGENIDPQKELKKET